MVNIKGSRANQSAKSGISFKCATIRTKMTLMQNWTKLAGSDQLDYASYASISSDESIYLVGGTNGDLDDEINNGLIDAFISKYNIDGTKEWSVLVGSEMYDSASSVSIGSDGSIYLAGSTFGDLDGETNNGSSDAFISKYNIDGTREWTKLVGSEM